MKVIWAVVLSLFVAGCESSNDIAYTPQIVIQGFLYANEPIDSVVIRRTLSITSNDESDRVTDAKVTISTDDTSFELHHDPIAKVKGEYVTSGRVIVRPGTTYRIRVEAFGQTATAETKVPEAIHLDSVKYLDRTLSTTGVDSVAYPKHVSELSSPGIQQWWSDSPGAAGYALEAVSLDRNADLIVIDFQDPIPDSTAIGRYRFLVLSRTEQVTWLQFKRYGLNAIRALALDRNYQDFILGLYISGSQYNNNTLHVSGGLGVFGSAARTFKRVYLE